jgi:hypothetical protein
MKYLFAFFKKYGRQTDRYGYSIGRIQVSVQGNTEGHSYYINY